MQQRPQQWPWRPKAAALTLLIGSVISAAAGQSPLAPSRQAELRTLVLQDCGSCHGMTLKGGLGKPLVKESLRDLEAESLAAIILDGVPGTPMPPWRGLISETEAAWIAARLKEGLQ